MSGRAIVVREHVMNGGPRGPYCVFCGLSAPKQDCEPRLAAVPPGYTGETVEVDDNTAAYLESKATP